VRDRIVRTYMLIKKYRSAIKLCTGAKTKWMAYAVALLPHLSNGGTAGETNGDVCATAAAVHVHPLVARILADAAFKTALGGGIAEAAEEVDGASPGPPRRFSSTGRASRGTCGRGARVPARVSGRRCGGPRRRGRQRGTSTPYRPVNGGEERAAAGATADTLAPSAFASSGVGIR